MKKFLVGALLLFVFAITLPVLSYGQSCNIRKARGRSVNYSNALPLAQGVKFDV